MLTEDVRYSSLLALHLYVLAWIPDRLLLLNGRITFRISKRSQSSYYKSNVYIKYRIDLEL